MLRKLINVHHIIKFSSFKKKSFHSVQMLNKQAKNISMYVNVIEMKNTAREISIDLVIREATLS